MHPLWHVIQRGFPPPRGGGEAGGQSSPRSGLMSGSGREEGNLTALLPFSAGEPAGQRHGQTQRHRGAAGVGGSSGEAEWETPGLFGGVQHPLRPAGQWSAA